jgi:hypothetical protein
MRRFDSDPRLQNPEIRELVFSEAFYARLVLRRGGILLWPLPGREGGSPGSESRASYVTLTPASSAEVNLKSLMESQVVEDREGPAAGVLWMMWNNKSSRPDLFDDHRFSGGVNRA